MRRIRARGCACTWLSGPQGGRSRSPSPPPGRMLSPKALMADPGTKTRGGRARESSRPSPAGPISGGRGSPSASPASPEGCHSGCQPLSGSPAPQGAPVGGGGEPTLLHRLGSHFNVNHTGQAVGSPRVGALSQMRGQSWLHPAVGTNFLKWRGCSGRGAQCGPPRGQPPAK